KIVGGFQRIGQSKVKLQLFRAGGNESFQVPGSQIVALQRHLGARPARANRSLVPAVRLRQIEFRLRGEVVLNLEIGLGKGKVKIPVRRVGRGEGAHLGKLRTGGQDGARQHCLRAAHEVEYQEIRGDRDGGQ